MPSAVQVDAVEPVGPGTGFPEDFVDLATADERLEGVDHDAALGLDGGVLSRLGNQPFGEVQCDLHPSRVFTNLTAVAISADEKCSGTVAKVAARGGLEAKIV
jgi:hypothetical protein